MDVPDEVLLARIQIKNVYLDKKSKEKPAGKTKEKYKLAGDVILDDYFFNVLTTDLTACKARLTLKIEQKDWEERLKGNYLPEDVGYCDITKYDLIYKDELLQKMRKYSFPYVAKLCELKYKELQALRNKANRDPFITKEAKNIIAKGIPRTIFMIDKIASELGID